MPVVSRVIEDSLVIEASGRITIGQGDALLRDAVVAAVESGHRKIALDLSEVRALDSSGVGEMVAAHRLVQSVGGRLVLAGLSSKVGGVLAATRLTGILEIDSSLDTALLSLAA
ncbi:MAG: STAS domain-containing protein [Thermoanaerobaculia bacterium]|nr:STAS domain-containing protein [Thermoanaerobaculia bacterium]